MKSFIQLFLFLIVSLIVTAQPNTFNYQTIIRGTDGQPIKNQNLTITCSIYDSETGGTPVWLESQNVQTNEFGLMVTSLGTIIQLSEEIFYNTDLWLKVSFTILGDEMLTVVKFETVPYAFRANTAQIANELLYMGEGSGLDADLLDGLSSEQLLYLENILLFSNNAGGNTISNLADPVNPWDCATKNYVDGLMVKLDELEQKILKAEKQLNELEDKISDNENNQ